MAHGLNNLHRYLLMKLLDKIGLGCCSYTIAHCSRGYAVLIHRRRRRVMGQLSLLSAKGTMRSVLRSLNRREDNPRLVSSRRALACICLLVLSARVVQAAGKPEELRLELTPREVHVNRTLPAFVPASKAQTISDNPSDDEIGILRLFPERIVPVNPGKSQSVLSGLKNLFSTKTPAPTNLHNRHVVSTLRALQCA